MKEEVDQSVDGDDLDPPFRHQARRQVDETVEVGGHAHQRREGHGTIGTAQLERQREAEIGDERKRVCRIDRDRRQYRHDLLAEELLQVFELIRRQIVRLVYHHILGEQLLPERLPGVLLFEVEVLGEGGDFLQLFHRRQPVDALLGEAGADLVLQAGDADHEELIEIVGRYRQEAQAFEQRMVLVARFLEHAHVELQPAHLAVDKARRALPQRLNVGSRRVAFSDFRHVIHRLPPIPVPRPPRRELRGGA